MPRAFSGHLTALWPAAILFVALATSAESSDPKQVRLFRAANPCPATSKTIGRCSG